MRCVPIMFQGNVRQKDDKNLLYAATDTDQEDEYSTVQKRYKSAVLSYHNITYSLQVRYRGFACCAKYKDRDILRELSGVMKPGMNAILGPTGSGKTSLLDILAGRKEVGTIDGTVLLDGFPLPKTFKCMSGYVVQDDIVMGTLTVRENLNFSAALRLPGKKTSQERQARVDAVLLDLGLQHVADSMVGNEYIRGISGGERKRTNIGMELIIAPSVLFLDEPTTGLDAYTAVSVMQLLQCLSKKGKTIIFSIHQPRYSIVKLFDTITLLGNGQTVYHGPASKALTYFEQIGYDCEEHDNPADFFLDTIQNVTAEEERELRDPSLPVRYERSDYAQHAQSELAEIHDGFLNQDSKPQPAERAGYPRSRPYQFFIVSKRSFLNIIRTPGASIIQIMIYVILAVIVGGIYYQLGHSSKDGIQNRVGALFFIVINMVYSNMSAVELFLKQRVIFMHESVSGYYAVSSYFLAKVVCDMIPLRIIPVAAFSAICYYMIGFQKSLEKFFFFLLSLVLTSLTASATAFLFSSLVRIQALATLFLALTFTFMMIFGGLFVNLTTLPEVLHWLKYLSIFRYAMEGLEINELEGQLFCNEYQNVTSCPPESSNTTSGTMYLKEQGFYPPVQKWYAQLALGCILLGILLLTYLRLRFMRKTR